MRLVFAGTPVTALPTLRALAASRHTVAAVVTRPDAPAGRGKKVHASPVAELAEELGFETLKPARPNEGLFLERLRAIAPDCCPVTAYGALLPQSALDIPPQGWVNLHFSVLPAWRGAAPVQHAILHGDDITGATTFRIVKELDAGPVFGTVTEPVRPADTSGDLLDRLAVSGAELMVRTLDAIEDGTVRAVPQPADGVSFAPKLTPADARVNWKLPAHLIDRQLRACTPDPGGWTEFVVGQPGTGQQDRGHSETGHSDAGHSETGHSETGRLKLWSVTLAAGAGLVSSADWASGGTGLAPGELRIDRNAVYAGTGTIPVRLGDVQPQGKRRMPAPDWTRGVKVDGAAGAPPPALWLRLGGRAMHTGDRATSSGSRAPRDAAAKRGTGRRNGDPRRTAYDVLKAVREREAYANLLLPKLLADRQLTGRDAALATELAYGTLRGRGAYDAVLAACSDRPLEKLDPPVLDVLRLGAHQLLSTRVGAYAAVATSVDLAKSVAGPRVSGYVNAVLRRVATRDTEAWLGIVAPDQAADRDGSLAIRHSHPRWIVAAYRAALGGAADSPAQTFIADPPAPTGTAPAGTVTELEAALAAGNARPRVTMATFPAGSPREDVMPEGAVPGRWSPYAFTLQSGDPSPLVESGAAAVQDEGSQLAAIALSRAPVTRRDGRDTAGADHAEAERWLDMCAGPGGKSRLLYGLAAGSGATLVAAELHPHRAVLVKAALSRASSAASAQHAVIVADGTEPAWPDGAFDRVLVDAPCSGLGALRRRPEARWRKSEADLKELTALQRDLLRSALSAVRPGGAVAYVTCSPVPAETSDVVAKVTASLPGVEFLDVPRLLPGVPALSAANPRFAQLWPHRHGTDAIFIAILRRPA